MHICFSRVSVDTIEEELKEWEKEINEINEMMSLLDEKADDFLLQLQEFVSVSAISASFSPTFLPLSQCLLTLSFLPSSLLVNLPHYVWPATVWDMSYIG